MWVEVHTCVWNLARGGKIFLLPIKGGFAMKQKAQIMDATAISRAMARITHEIIERNQGVGSICLLGVRRRGVPLAAMLAQNIKRFEGVEVPLGYLDITRHRDDLTEQEKIEKNGGVSHSLRHSRTYRHFGGRRDVHGQNHTRGT